MASRVAQRCYSLLSRSAHTSGLSLCARPAHVVGVRYTQHRTGTTLDALGQRRKAKTERPTTSPSTPRTAAARPPASPTAKLQVHGAPAATAATARAERPKDVEKELKVGYGKRAAPPAKDKDEAKSTTDELEDVERLMQIAQMFPGTDIWGQQVPTLDVKIPRSAPEGASLRKKWDVWKFNKENDLYNAYTMWQMAQSNSFPGVEVYKGGVKPGPHSVWQRLRKSFRASSQEDTEWISGVRNASFDTYMNLNKAIATADMKNVKRLATATYAEQVLKLAKTYDRPDRVFRWQMQGLNAPIEVLSIRCADGYLGVSEPKTGSRLLIHALVRLDTNQSFEALARRGGQVLYSNSKRVVEYLVFEKRCWYEHPWVIREQFFERVPPRS